jgi:hypothetical protein
VVPDVEACTEGATGAFHYHDPAAAVMIKPAKIISELSGHPVADGIESLRAVEGQPVNAAIHIYPDILVVIH